NGISIPGSVIIRRAKTPTVPLPTVLKSQVPTGERGKAGGIKVVTTEAELKTTINNLFKLSIKGLAPTTLLAEEKLEIEHEYYVSLLIDRPSATIHLVAHKNGGVDIEDNSARDNPLQLTITKESFD